MATFLKSPGLFTSEERETIRKNLALGNRMASKAIKKRGLKPHPRIQEWLGNSKRQEH